jgi:hypothetical protein
MLMPEGIDIIIISVTAVEFDVLAQSYVRYDLSRPLCTSYHVWLDLPVQ